MRSLHRTGIPKAWQRPSSARCSARTHPSSSTSTATPRSCTNCSTAGPAPDRFHVRGYVEEGTTTTPYDLLVSNGVSRHDVAITALGHLRGRSGPVGDLAAAYAHHRHRLREEFRRTGVDPAEMTEWKWQP
jgi:hypothetical protein